ncbi:pyridoxamine kinase [uncultured Eubacterium sp.]|uniref:pyridoxamine kinase n=1 Tax=uncultured Eubacterium sp. TaxID=165185 RepID=UPI0015C0BF2F|nr:pyridoxamine kinase [uncultured Eubacterium sp.]
MKRIVTVQDISCLGKCSITVALPIISAMGIEASVIPTSILSTHTLFDGYVHRDMCDMIEPIINHWKSQGFTFDAIYTGYLGSKEQISLVEKLIDKFRTDSCFVLVDPAMADNGTLYPGFDNEHIDKMRELCSMADIIVPNLTEACLLTGTQYQAEYDDEYITDILNKLICLGAKKAVITAVIKDGKYGIISFDSEIDRIGFYAHEKIDQTFYGTGDVFSSACVGALVNGNSLAKSVEIAGEFVFESIQKTVSDKDARLYGVNFEKALPMLAKYNE